MKMIYGPCNPRSREGTERPAFTTSRAMEFFTEKELCMQIGHGRRLWPIALSKEAIDNGLDACEENGEAPGIEVLGERRDQKNRVDVRGDHLLLHRTPRGRARHDAPPLQAGVNDRTPDAHPISHRGKIGRCDRFMTESPADLGPAFHVAGDAIQPALLFHHAGKLQIPALEPRRLLSRNHDAID